MWSYRRCCGGIDIIRHFSIIPRQMSEAPLPCASPAAQQEVSSHGSLWSEYGVRVWGRRLGSAFGARVLGQSLGSEFGVSVWGCLGSAFGVRVWGQSIGLEFGVRDSGQSLGSEFGVKVLGSWGGGADVASSSSALR